MKSKTFNAVRSLAFGYCLAMACVITATAPAHAGGAAATPAAGNSSKIAPQPCDPRYWETLSARAWMEAEREIMQNQNLIFKPDSVLQYTCFDNMVSHGAKYLGDIFVHTDYFGKIIIQRGAAQAQEIALQNVVTTTLKSYIENNFSNKFLAQRSEKLRNKPAKDERKPGGSGWEEAKDMKAYQGCNIMAEVWKASKCINFIDNDEFKNTDGFYPFRTLQPGPNGGQAIPGYESIGDTRAWPQFCSDKVKGQEWVDKDKIATNEGDKVYPFKDPLKKDYEDIRKLVEPGGLAESGGKDGKCGDGIETGVTIILSGANGGGAKKKDKVCTNPGCTLIDDKCQ